MTKLEERQREPGRIDSYYLKTQSILKRKHCLSITELVWFLLFKEVITVYSENDTNETHKYTLWEKFSF
jgi:hypothetical protein